jgi:hypothetical protein
MIKFSTFFIAWRSGSKCGTLRVKQKWKKSDGGAQCNHARLTYPGDFLKIMGSFIIAPDLFYQSAAFILVLS